MKNTVDIFSPQVSKITRGLEGKVIMIYGGNNLGKTDVASHMSKPFFFACESGLNAISGVKYSKVNKWVDFRTLVEQLTERKTVDKARELYDTIVIDEVYASSILCQEYCITTYGEGALTLGDPRGKVNLYQAYEKEYFRAINLLLSCDYTVVFIAHDEEKEGYTKPKGDKRCLRPIIDACDFVIYLTSNGVDENGNVIKSSGHLAETDTYFARSRFKYCPTLIEEFTAENLEKAIITAIEKKEEIEGIQAISYDEYKKQKTTADYDYDDVMKQLEQIGQKFQDSDNMAILTEIVEDVLGAGKRVSECTKKQTEAMVIILNGLIDKAEELGL